MTSVSRALYLNRTTPVERLAGRDHIGHRIELGEDVNRIDGVASDKIHKVRNVLAVIAVAHIDAQVAHDCLAASRARSADG